MLTPLPRAHAIIAVAVALGWGGAAEPVAGQGLLRRLQDRIQTRVEAATENRGERQSGAENSDDGAKSGTRPGSGTEPAQGATSRLAVPIGPVPSAAGDPALGPATERFGESILAQPGDGDRPDTPPASPQVGKPTMGVLVIPDTGIPGVLEIEGSQGLRVTEIRPDSLARQAGLRVDDLIVAVDGIPTPTTEAIASLLHQRQVGDSVRASVQRGDAVISVVIPLLDSRMVRRTPPPEDEQAAATLPEPVLSEPTLPKPLGNQAVDSRVESMSTTATGDAIDLGIEVAAAEGQRGVLVKTLHPGSAAAEVGVRVGDRIVSIDGRLIRDATTYQQQFAQRSLGERLSLIVVREQTLHQFEVVVRPVNPDVSGVDGLAGQPGSRSAGSGAAGPNGDTQVNQGGASVLGGLGSVLGGLFGGSPRQPRPADSSTNGDAADETDGALNPTRGGTDSQDQTVQPADGDSRMQDESQPLPNDPPSVEALKPPVLDSPAIEANESEIEKDRIIQSLREEIRLLRQRLEALEGGRS